MQRGIVWGGVNWRCPQDKMQNLAKKLRQKNNLLEAWRTVRQTGILSRSKEIRDKVREFEIDLIRNITRLQRKLRNNSFEFRPAKGVLIKRHQKEPRPIVIAPIEERIIQRCLLQILSKMDYVKNEVNHPLSFGGLIKKGVRQAIETACLSINQGANYFIKSDIKDFFSNIPRQVVIEKIKSFLPDDSIDNILTTATNVELDNLSNINQKYRGLFPTYDLGVAQGFCLSPLFGNILLVEFDRIMNEGACKCIRYIDDFIILGENNRQVYINFKNGVKVLNNLGLDVYYPSKNKEKAKEGSTRRSFNFLGCSISKDFVHPDKGARSKIIGKIQYSIDESKKAFWGSSRTNSMDTDLSFINTLRRINDTLKAWGSHYSFCNSTSIFVELDKKIDKLIRDYIRSYDRLKNKLDEKSRRKFLGIHLLQDSKTNPILPIKAKKRSSAEIIEEEMIDYDYSKGEYLNK